jgi:hypothetical protein
MVDELFFDSFVQGKSGRKTETQSRKANVLSFSEGHAGWAAKGRKLGAATSFWGFRQTSSRAYLLTKANPPKGGDAKLRD